MKNKAALLILAVVLSVLLFAAVLLYNKYSDRFGGTNLVPETQSVEAPTDDTAPTDQTASLAPDFTVLDYAGNPVQLSDYIGKPVVLNFWATWCYYCKEEMPDFNTACEKYPEVQFLMINATDGVQETVEKAKNYIEQSGYGFDVFFDTEQNAVRTYGITGFPTTFFIDAEGKLAARASGMLDLETLEQGIQMIQPEEPGNHTADAK